MTLTTRLLTNFYPIPVLRAWPHNPESILHSIGTFFLQFKVFLTGPFFFSSSIHLERVASICVRGKGVLLCDREARLGRPKEDDDHQGAEKKEEEKRPTFSNF